MKKALLTTALVAVFLGACSTTQDDTNTTASAGALTQAQIAGTWRFTAANFAAAQRTPAASDGTVWNGRGDSADVTTAVPLLTTAQIAGTGSPAGAGSVARTPQTIEASRSWIVGSFKAAAASNINYNLLSRNAASDNATNTEPGTMVVELNYVRAGGLWTRSGSGPNRGGLVQPFPRWVKIAVRTNGSTISMYSSTRLYPGSLSAAAADILDDNGAIRTDQTFVWATRSI